MSDTPKRFEDWEEVDCNDCAHYWQDSCDGVSKGSRVGCNSFLATRSIVIPERLNKLENNVKFLKAWVYIMSPILGFLLGRVLFGG